jgi:hypothetical protein
MWAQMLPGPAAAPVLVANPEPARKSRRWVALAVGALVLVVLVGVVIAVASSGTSTPAAAPTQAATSVPTAALSASAVASPTPSEQPTWVDKHAGDLARFLVPMPAGAKPLKTKPANEKLDLAGASLYGADSSGFSEHLQLLGFSRGVVRRWSVGIEVYEVVLFQFGDPSGASDLCASLKRGNESSTEWRSVTAATFGSIFVSTSPTEGFITQLGLGVVDDVMVFIRAATKPSTGTKVIEDLVYAEVHLL